MATVTIVAYSWLAFWIFPRLTVLRTDATITPATAGQGVQLIQAGTQLSGAWPTPERQSVEFHRATPGSTLEPRSGTVQCRRAGEHHQQFEHQPGDEL